jgi:hypothetical protein
MKTAKIIGLTCVLAAACGSVRAQEATRKQEVAWTPLFNGQDLAGWEHVGAGGFVIEDGVLKTEGGMGLLWFTERSFRDGVLRVEYRNPGGRNAGIFIRIPEPPADPWEAVHGGYEVQIDDLTENENEMTGVLYSLTLPMARPSRPGEWNTMEIILDGDRTVVTVNGVLVTYYREGDRVLPRQEVWQPERGPRPSEGFIGLQNHGPGDVVYFRSIARRRPRLRRQPGPPPP